jgi:hypothetical protein
MTTRPSLYSLAREAALNAASSPVRTSLIAALSALIGGAVVLSTAGNVNDVVQAHRAQELRGLSTLSVTAADDEPLSAAGCDSLTSIEVVNSAGGEISTARVQPANSPITVTVRHVSPGYLAVAFPGEDTKGLESIAGRDLREELGLVPGGLLAEGSESAPPITIHEVASTPARIDGTNRDVLVAAPPTGTVTECLVDVANGQSETVASVIPSHFSSAVVVRHFLASDSVDRDPASELRHRWSGLVWLAGGLGIVLFNSYAWWSRRHETALYRLLGFRPESVATVVALEMFLVSLVPSQISVAWALAIAPMDSGVVTSAVIADISRFALLLSIAPVVAVGISMTGSTVDRLKGQ